MLAIAPILYPVQQHPVLLAPHTPHISADMWGLSRRPARAQQGHRGPDAATLCTPESAARPARVYAEATKSETTTYKS